MHIDSGDHNSGVVSSWFDLFQRRWKAGAGIFLVVLGLAAWLVLSSPPVYRADSRLRLGEPPPMGGVSPNAGILGFFNLGGNAFSNDLELLASRTLAEGVVRDAALNATLRAPRGWHQDSLFLRYAATPATVKQSYSLRWTEDGKVESRRTIPDDSLVSMAAPGETLSFGGVEVVPRPWRRGMPREVKVSTVSYAEASRLTRGRLKFERIRREANVVEITYDSPDPTVAHTAVASIVARFVELRTDIQQRESDVTVDSLRVVANRTQIELEQAERGLEELQRSAQLIAPEAQSDALVERYSGAVGELERARSELGAVDALLQRIDAAPESTDAWADLAGYPSFVENITIGELLSGLTRLEDARAELVSRRTDSSRELRVVVEQIEQRDSSLRAIARGYHTAIQQRIGPLEAQVRSMEATFSRMPGEATELGRRQRSVRLLSEVLVLTEQRLRQEELRQALTFANVQVIDPPALLDKPVWPRKKMGLGVGFLLASLCGLLGMVVSERADRTVSRAAEVRSLIGAPVLALATRTRAGAVSLTPQEIRVILHRRNAAADPGQYLVLAPVGDVTLADEIAAMLRSDVALGNGNGNGSGPPVITTVPPVDGYAAAAEIAEAAPIILTVTCGRTSRNELRQTVELLRQGGGEILGAILIVPRRGRVGSGWK